MNFMKKKGLRKKGESHNSNKLFDQLTDISNLPSELGFMEVSQLLFKCKMCGNCCHKLNGVAVGDIDIERLCKHLKCSPDQFKKDMLVENPTSKSEPYLKGTYSTNATGKCIFYNNGCSVYKARPTVCRVFPLLNEEERGFKPHLYDFCPGTVDFAREIHAYKLMYPEINLSMDETMIIQLIKVMAHLSVNSLLEIENSKISEVKKSFKTLNISEGDIRGYALKYLASATEMDNLEQFLLEVSKQERDGKNEPEKNN